MGNFPVCKKKNNNDNLKVTGSNQKVSILENLSFMAGKEGDLNYFNKQEKTYYSINIENQMNDALNKAQIEKKIKYNKYIKLKY